MRCTALQRGQWDCRGSSSPVFVVDDGMHVTKEHGGCERVVPTKARGSGGCQNGAARFMLDDCRSLGDRRYLGCVGQVDRGGRLGMGVSG